VHGGQVVPAGQERTSGRGSRPRKTSCRRSSRPLSEMPATRRADDVHRGPRGLLTASSASENVDSCVVVPVRDEHDHAAKSLGPRKCFEISMREFEIAVPYLGMDGRDGRERVCRSRSARHRPAKMTRERRDEIRLTGSHGTAQPRRPASADEAIRRDMLGCVNQHRDVAATLLPPRAGAPEPAVLCRA